MAATEPLLFAERVRSFGHTLELGFALQVQQNGGFFDEAALEDAFDYFVAVQRLAGFTEDLGDDVGDSALFVAPFFEGVDAAADQHKALIFDELVVDGLRGNVFALKVGIFDSSGYLIEVHVLAVRLEDNVNFVANVLGVDDRPLN